MKIRVYMEINRYNEPVYYAQYESLGPRRKVVWRPCFNVTEGFKDKDKAIKSAKRFKQEYLDKQARDAKACTVWMEE